MSLHFVGFFEGGRWATIQQLKNTAQAWPRLVQRDALKGGSVGRKCSRGQLVARQTMRIQAATWHARAAMSCVLALGCTFGQDSPGALAQKLVFRFRHPEPFRLYVAIDLVLCQASFVAQAPSGAAIGHFRQEILDLFISTRCCCRWWSVMLGRHCDVMLAESANRCSWPLPPAWDQTPAPIL